MKRRPRWWQLALLLILGVLLLGLGLLTMAYLGLRSPDMQQRILGSIREPLAKAGVVLDVESLSLDLFAGLNLQKMHIKIDRPPMIQADLQLARLRLGYALWGLLQNKLVVSEVLLEGLRGEVQLNLGDEPPPPEPPPAGLKALLDLLRKPPLTLDGPSLIVRDNQLKLHLKQGSRQIEVQLQEADIESSVSLQPGILELSSRSKFKLAVALEQAEPKTGTLRVQSHIALAPQLKLKVEAPPAQFNWQLDLAQVDLQIKDSKVHKATPEGATVDLQLAALQWSPALHLQRAGSVSDNPQALELVWPLDMQGAQKILVQGLSLEQKSGAQSLSLKTSLSAEQDWKVHLPQLELSRELNWTVNHSMELSRLHAEQNGKILAANESIQLALHSDAELGQGRLGLQVDISPLSSTLLNAPLASHLEFNAGFNLLAPALRLLGSGTINGEKLFSLNGEGKDEANLLRGHVQLELTPKPALGAVHSGLQALEKLGWPQIEVDLSHHTQHPMALAALDSKNWQELTITNSIKLNIRQLRPGPKNLVNFKSLSINNELTLPARPKQALASQLETKTVIKAEALEHASLKKTVDLQQSLDLTAALNDRISGQLQARTRLDSAELASLQFSWQDKEGELGLDSQLDVQLEPSLQKIVAAAQALDDFGGIKLTSRHRIKLGHHAHRLLDLKGLDPERIDVDAHLSQSLSQTAVGREKRTLSWSEPLRIDSRVQLHQGRAELLTRVTEAELTAKDQARVVNLQALIKASLSDLKSMARAEVKIMSDASGVELLKEIPDQQKIHQLLKNFKFVLHGLLENKDRLTIKTLFVGLHDQLLQFKGQGAFRLSGQGNFDGQLESQLTGITGGPFRGEGRLQVPIKLVLFDKTRISLDADPKFQAFSLDYGDIQIKRMNGGIAIHEELSIDPAGRIGFLYLNTQNPFARVDYDSLDPYVGDRSLLSLEQLRFKHIQIGPLVENFEVRQNLILLNDLKMDLFQGSALGRFYLDLDPARLQLGFLGRFSGIQSELIKEPQRRIPTKEWAPLSGRMAVNFDIRKRLATGRLDLTEIGQRQLLSLLDVLDPEYKDDQMIMARRALHVSYPQSLAVSMEQGLMDMNISLGGAISKDLSIRSIPLSAMINSKAGEALQKIETFLQSGVTP